MSECLTLDYGTILNYYGDVWDPLCCYTVPSQTYDDFVNGLTEYYNNSCPKDKVFSDYVTKLYNNCLSGSSGGGGTGGTGVYVTGGTANGANSTLNFTNTTGGTFTVTNSALLFNDAFVTGGTLNQATGVVTFTNSSGGTFTVSGFDDFASYWSGSSDGTSITTSGSNTTTNVNLPGLLGVTGDTTINGDLYVTEYIKHKGDANTAIRFTDNKISFDAGGMTFFAVHDDGSAPFTATVNGGSNKINFKAMDENNDLLLKTDSEENKVNLYHAGNQKLETTSTGINISGSTLNQGNLGVSGITYSNVVSANTQHIANTLGISGKTYLGSVDTATATASDKILVVQSTGEIESITTGALTAFTSDYWVGNGSGTGIKPSGTTTNVDVTGVLGVTGNSTFGGSILLGDGGVSSNYAGFGNNADLKIFHNGGHSIIRETGTGSLYLQSDNNVIISKDSSTELMVKGIADGAVELYYDNVKKFETTSSGVNVSGNTLIKNELGVSGRTYLGTIDAAGGSYSADKILVAQGDGEIEYLTTAELKADIADADYWTGNTDGTSITPSGGTTNTDIKLNGGLTAQTLNISGNTSLGDNDKIMLGADNDLEVYANSSGGRIAVGSSTLQVEGNTLDFTDGSATSYLFRGVASGAVSLYHSGTKKFETTSSGINVSGNTLVKNELGVSGKTYLGTIDAAGGSYSADKILVAQGDGEVEYLTTAQLKADIGDNDYWIGNGSGTGIKPSGGTVNVDVTGQLGVSGDTTINGNLYVSQYIKHNGDPNTYLEFYDDRLLFNIGGISYLDLNDASSAPHDIIFNNGNNDVDLTIKGGSSTILFTDASTHRVGIGTETPTVKLDVNGDVKISGDTSIKTNLGVTGVTYSNIVSANTQHIASTLGISGRTFLGTVDAASPTPTSTDKILVVQSTGEIESITKAQLTGFTENYWSSNTDSLSISPSGSTNILLSGGTGTGYPLTIDREDNGHFLKFHSNSNPHQDYTFESESSGTFYGLNLKNKDGDTIVNFAANQMFGVGTINPTVAIDIDSGLSGADALQVRIAGRTGIGHSSAGQQRSIFGNSYGHDETRMGFVIGGLTTADEKITVMGTGDVGIGTATETIRARLHVSGSTILTDSLGVSGNTNINGVLSGVTDARFGGNLGVSGRTFLGTVDTATATASDKILVVQSTGEIESITTGALTAFTSDYWVGNGSGTGIKPSGTTTNVDVTGILGVSGKTFLTGLVGVGTTTPDSLLEISSSDGSTTDYLKLTSANSGNNPIKLIFEKSGSEQGIIEYNRNGDLEIYNNDGDGGVMIDGSASAGGDLYVANSGNVGVKTTNPSVELDVNGSVKITGNTLNQGNLGVTGVTYSNIVSANTQHIASTLGISGKTFLGSVDTATATASDKILVVQSTGEIESITTAALTGFTSDYWEEDGTGTGIQTSGYSTTTVKIQKLNVAGGVIDYDHSSGAVKFGQDQSVIFNNDNGDVEFTVLGGGGGTTTNKVLQLDLVDGGHGATFFTNNGNTTNQTLVVNGIISGNTNARFNGVVGISGRTYLGTIDAAGGSYSNDKILVAQSNGEVEYLTTAQLKADIGDNDYWTGNTDGTSITPSGGTTNTDIKLNGGLTAQTLNISGNTILGDDDKIMLGDANDLQIFHNGSHSIIKDVGTGHLSLQGNDLRLNNADWSANYLTAANGGEVAIFHNNSLKLETTSSGLNVSGNTLVKNELGVSGRTYLGTIDAAGGSYSADKILVAQGDGEVEYLTTAQLKADIGDNDYWVGNGSGTGVKPSGTTTNVDVTGVLGVSGKTNITGDLDVDGTSNLDAVDIDGNVQLDGTLTVGVDDTGYDVKFYGATTSRFLHWDESEDYLLFRDNVKGVFGNGADLKLYHDSNNSYIENGTGALYIMQRADGADMSFQCDAGDGTDAEYFRLDGGDVKTIFSKPIQVGVDDTGYDVKFFGDTASSYMLWDTSEDRLEVGSDTSPKIRLNRSGTGQVWQQEIDSSGRFQLKEAASAGGTLYVRLQIDDTGEVDLYNTLTVGGGDVIISGDTFNKGNLGVTGNTYVKGNTFIDGTLSAMGNTTLTGTLDLNSVAAITPTPTSTEVILVKDTSGVVKSITKAQLTGITEGLYWEEDGTGTGIKPSGATTNIKLGGGLTAQTLNISGNTILGDNDKIMLGADNDLEIYSDSTNGRIAAGSGVLQIEADTLDFTDGAATEYYIRCVANGSVSLYHDANKKFETTVAGINVSGNTLVKNELGVSGKTYLGDIGAAGDGYSADKILVAQGDGEVEYLTTAQLKADIGDNDYWQGNGSGTGIKPSGTTTNVDVTGQLGVSGDTTISGDLLVAEYIKHAGDSDTFIQFADDSIGINAGNEQLITISESPTFVKIGDGGDVDFQVRTNSDDNTLYVEGSTDNVGIGTNTPTVKLDVNGSVRITGDTFTKGNLGVTGGTYSNIVSANTQHIASTLGVSGKTYLGSVDTATATASDKILVVQSTGEIESITTGALTAFTSDYWVGNGSGTGIKPSGGTVNVDVTGELGVSGKTIVTGDLSTDGILYTDDIRRLTDNSTSTRISMGGNNLYIFAGSTTNAHVNFRSTFGTVFNDGGLATYDFRVEGDTDTHLIFADAGADKVAIGTDTVSEALLTVDGDTRISGDTFTKGNLGVTGNTYVKGNTYIDGTLSAMGNTTITGDLDVDGTSNLDNTDIDGTLVVDGTNISLDSTSTLNIDNSNTTNGITIGTATSAVPISIGHTTSETTINDNLTVTGTLDLDSVAAITPTPTSDEVILVKDTSGVVKSITKAQLTGVTEGLYWVEDGVGTGIKPSGATTNITIAGDIYANGNIDGDGSTNITDINQLEVSEIYGYNGDTDTKITFTDDDINITVGNVNMLDFTQDTVSEVTFNEAGVDIDVRMEGNTDQNLFFLDAGNDKIAIGTDTVSSSLLTVDGSIQAGSAGFIVGNATLTSAELDISSGNFTLDVEGDITLDTNGADIILSDDGTDFGRFKRDASHFIIKAETNNKDIIFRGQDAASTIDALLLDMSEAGSATFNRDVNVSGVTSGRTDARFGGDLSVTGRTFLGTVDTATATASDKILVVQSNGEIESITTAALTGFTSDYWVGNGTGTGIKPSGTTTNVDVIGQLGVSGETLFNGKVTGNGDFKIENLIVFETASTSANTYIGYQAGNPGQNTTQHQYNTAIGYQALYSQQGGQDVDGNTAIGYKSLYSITTGEWNTGIGEGALRYTTTQNGNTAIGKSAMGNSVATSGSYNVCVGYLAGYNVKGMGNLFFGIGTGAGNNGGSNTGGDNVGMGNYSVGGGSSAGVGTLTSGERNLGVGSNALGILTSGNDNIGIGSQAGDAITSGDFNIVIGAGQDVPSATGDYQMNIGGIIHGKDLQMSTGEIQISGNTILTNDLGVSGDTNINGTLSAMGNTTIGGTLDLDSVANATPTPTSAERILVKQTSGVVESITKAQLTGLTDFSSVATYWQGNGSGTGIKPSGTTTNVDVTGVLGVSGKTNITGDLDVDGTSNLDAVDIDGNVQLDGTFTVGVDDTGYDVKFFGATSGKYMLWDEDQDSLDVKGILNLEGGTTAAAPTPQLHFGNYYDSSGGPSISHIDLYNGDYGFGISVGDLDYISDIRHRFYSDTSAAADGTPALQIDGENNQVGVNMASASYSLDVTGDIRINSGALGVGVNPNGTDGRIDASNDVVAYSSSDKRWKENIQPIENALDKVSQISGVEFDWKKLTKEEKKTQHGNEGHDIGVIAQEIEKVLPEIVITRENGYKGVRYEKIVPLLIESIKELKAEITELKNK